MLSIATSERWTDKDGEKQERTDWHRCVAWGKKAEVIAEYFTKGEGIIIEGKIQTRSWETKDGDKRWTTEIIVGNFEFLPGKRSSGSASGGQSSSQPSQKPEAGDDIPF